MDVEGKTSATQASPQPKRPRPNTPPPTVPDSASQREAFENKFRNKYKNKYEPTGKIKTPTRTAPTTTPTINRTTITPTINTKSDTKISDVEKEVAAPKKQPITPKRPIPQPEPQSNPQPQPKAQQQTWNSADANPLDKLASDFKKFDRWLYKQVHGAGQQNQTKSATAAAPNFGNAKHASVKHAAAPTAQRATARQTQQQTSIPQRETMSGTPSRGYDAWETLQRRGWKAYFKRIANENHYQEACLKFMESEGCSFDMAQGNIDRMNEDPVAWALERLEVEKTGRKLDYCTADRQPVFENLYRLITHGNDYIAYDARFGTKEPPTTNKHGEPYYSTDDGENE